MTMDYVSPKDTKDMTAVGYWVTKDVYREYQQMANELYQQRVPDQEGNNVPLLEQPDVNLFMNFCVGFYKQYKDVMNQMTQNPNAQHMIEGIVEQLVKSGGISPN